MVSVSGLVSARQTSPDKFLHSDKKKREQVYLLETFSSCAAGHRLHVRLDYCR